MTLRGIQLEQIEQIEDKTTNGYIMRLKTVLIMLLYRAAIGSKDFTD